MKSVFRICGLLLLFACLSPAQVPLSQPRVAKILIQFVGPPAASEAFVRANIRVKVGDPYLPLAVDDDFQNLYATGLFYDIQVTHEITGSEVTLTYILQGKPQLTDIKFQGNTKYSTSKLKKKLLSKVGKPLDEQKLFTDSQEIEKMYQKAGLAGTTAKYLLTIDTATGKGTATFDIKESRKVKILRVDFVGAEAFTQKQLRHVIKTRKHRWWLSWLTRSGTFKEDVFAEDKDRLAEYYREKGYIDFEIREPVQFEYPTPRTMVVRFPVYEGRRYQVGSVKFSGNKLFTTEQIAQGLRNLVPKGVLLKKVKLGPNGLKMDVGDVFTQSGYLDDMKQIQDFYGSKGYVDVASTRNLNVVHVANTRTGTMDLEFKIDEGQQFRIEKIEIRGNTKTKDRVIRRELAVSPGDVFDTVRVELSKRRVQNLQYFSKVDARPEPPESPLVGRKNLVIGVDETDTGRMTMGAGFSSVDSLIVFAELTQGNFDLFNPPTFTGGGQKFRLRTQLGTERQDYEMSFYEPWFLERKLGLGVDLYYRDLNFVSVENLYDEKLAGAHVSLRRALGSEFVIGSVGYTLQQVGIVFNGQVINSNGPAVIPYIPPTLLSQRGYSLVSKFDASLAFDTRNSVMLPDKGQLTELSAEVAGPFGGSQDYYKLELKSHWYFKGLLSGHVLELGGIAGVADAYGSTASVPFYDRYYLGGLYSLRGFQYHGVAPRDPPDPVDPSLFSKEPVGGNTYWLGSAEYSVPIIEHVRFAVFYDIGDVLLDPYSFGRGDFSDNWGFGLRLNIPRLGPLRLDYGIPLHHDRFNSGNGRIQFSAGFERPF